MADRIDAAVQPLQASAGKTVLDRPTSEAECNELIARHDAVLLCRQGRNPMLR